MLWSKKCLRTLNVKIYLVWSVSLEINNSSVLLLRREPCLIETALEFVCFLIYFESLVHLGLLTHQILGFHNLHLTECQQEQNATPPQKKKHQTLPWIHHTSWSFLHVVYKIKQTKTPHEMALYSFTSLFFLKKKPLFLWSLQHFTLLFYSKLRPHAFQHPVFLFSRSKAQILKVMIGM